MTTRAWGAVVGCMVGGVICTALHDYRGNLMWAMLAVAIIGISGDKK